MFVVTVMEIRIISGPTLHHEASFIKRLDRSWYSLNTGSAWENCWQTPEWLLEHKSQLNILILNILGS